jgi:hypothetical protein
VKRTIRNLVIAFIILFVIFSTAFLIGVKEYRALEVKNIIVEKQLQDLQQQKEGYKEGKYTLITNLSSSIYLNKIPASLDKIDRWEDVNGVKFFDVTINGTHYRYVEGHIQMPQLALYAPNLHMEVVSEKVGP